MPFHQKMSAWRTVQCSPYLLLLVLATCQASSFEDMRNLTDTLFADYDKRFRPVIDHSKSVQVYMTCIYISLISVDTTAQSATMVSFMHMNWMNELLRWRPEDHSNISILRPSADQVWTPSIVMINTADSTGPINVPTEVIPLYLDHKGMTSWDPVATLKFSANLNMEKFPKDKHTLSVTFRVNTYLGHEVNLTTTARTVPGSDFPAALNSEWELLSVKIQPDAFVGKESVMPVIHVSFFIQRRPQFFLLNLLLPTCLMSFLNIFVFILPADSGEKIGFSLAVLLAITFFMSSTSSVLPQGSSSIPLVSQYLACLTCISVLTNIATIIILAIHHREEQSHRKNNLRHSVVRRFKNLVATSFRRSFKQKQVSSTYVRPTATNTIGPDWIENLVKRDPTRSAQHCDNKTAATTNFGQSDISGMDKTSPDGSCVNKQQPISIRNALQVQNAGQHSKLWSLAHLASSQNRNPSNDEMKEKSQNFGPMKGEENTDQNGQTSQDTSAASQGMQTQTPFFKRLSKNVDLFCFVFFMLAWISLTLYYMLTLFTDD